MLEALLVSTQLLPDGGLVRLPPECPRCKEPLQIPLTPGISLRLQIPHVTSSGS
jgi:hypothetical protein